MKTSRLGSLVHDVLRAGMMTAIAVALVMAPRLASAHAVLVQSSPAANATVSGHNVSVSMKFNSRVDGRRSTLQLVSPDGQTKTLPINEQAAPDTLTTPGLLLNPGNYAIHWQVLAVDGHITRGQIPFVVK